MMAFITVNREGEVLEVSPAIESFVEDIRIRSAQFKMDDGMIHPLTVRMDSHGIRIDFPWAKDRN